MVSYIGVSIMIPYHSEGFLVSSWGNLLWYSSLGKHWNI